MYAIRGSISGEKSGDFTEAPRDGTGPDANVRWLEQQVDALKDADEADDLFTWVLLLAGQSPYDFRLRVAQSQLRDDVSPSHWSHAALVESFIRPMEQTVLLEVPLEPEHGFGMPPVSNGVRRTDLAWYGDPALVPNLAVLRVPVEADKWRAPQGDAGRSVLEQFSRQRVIVDEPDLILRWLAFVWGVSTATNPIRDGAGIPSAVMVETVVGQAGFDMSPGLDSPTSTPEGFWQAATWWHDYYARQQREGITGRWVVGDRDQLTQGPPRQSPADAGPAR
jgi:hypothetical protein